MQSKTAILLLNIGSPLNPGTSAVRKFLSEFLNDRRVIDIPWLFRKILVNIIIVPFRTHSAAIRYKMLWKENGSPLILHGISLQEKLQKKLGEDYIVAYASNYQHPNIKMVTAKICNLKVSRIIAFPLFPQYASSTTGSAFEKLFKILSDKNTIPAVTTIQQYYSHPAFIEAMVSNISEYDYHSFDHIIMSYHGLPVSQVNKSHNGNSCDHFNCTREVTEKNIYCYHSACYGTSRLLAEKLNLDENMYTVSFQSRISKNWLSPFTDEIIIKLAKQGKKRLLIICPSFTADCLETIIEVGEVYRDLFIRNGGTNLTMVKSLNDGYHWVDAITDIVCETSRL
jgi:protoporphyrin/coproporphyrin ferrochelatase